MAERKRRQYHFYYDDYTAVGIKDADTLEIVARMTADDVMKLKAERATLLEEMEWVVMQTGLLHGLGRSIVKADIRTIKEHAERAIRQVTGGKG